MVLFGLRDIGNPKKHLRILIRAEIAPGGQRRVGAAVVRYALQSLHLVRTTLRKEDLDWYSILVSW